MAHHKIKLLLVLAAALLCLQCNNGYDGSLFPSFLVNVAFHRNVGDTFQHAAGEKYFFYIIPVSGAGTEYVYVVQTLPGGNRRVAIFNGALVPLQVFDNPAVGGMHAEIDNSRHLIGREIMYFLPGVTPTLSGDVTLAGFGSVEDYFMTRNSGNYTMFQPTVYAGSITRFDSNSFTFSSGFSGGAGMSTTINIPGHSYVIEGAGSNNTSFTCVVLRDTATDEAYFYTYTAATPAANIDFGSMIAIGRIVPGTVRFTADGRPVIERYNGRLCRFDQYGFQEDDTTTSDFRDYLTAYGYNNGMYLFNPSTFDLMKTIAWWRGAGY